MGFQNLRSNNLIYILHKGDTPTIEVGKVSNVSIPVPKYANLGIFNADMTVDISVNVNDNITNFQKLPASLEIADVGSNIVVACNKNAMNDEVNAMKQKSLEIIDSIERHLKIIEGCEEIIKFINPEIAEKEKLKQETNELKEEINSLKTMFQEFITQFNK